MASVLLVIFLLSFLFLFLYKYIPNILGFSGAFVVLGIFLYFTGYIQPIIRGEKIIEETVWVPTLGMNIRFYLDGLSLFFALLVSLFGSFILLYAIGYMRGHDKANRFFCYLTIFMGSMIGLVLSDHLVLLYVFWEITSISSYFLISYNNHSKKARKAGMQALLTTSFGGLALFAGLLLMAHNCQSFHLSTILQSEHNLAGSGTIISLILIGCFTKSAQFPFHFWLPNAMEAPSPVSAYLHSATMVKAGIFLIMRLNPIFGDDSLWQSSLLAIGTISMLIGMFKATKLYDMKGVLASITISTLGALIAMIGFGYERALQGAVIYLLVHALYKAALFLAAGNIDKQAKTRDLRKLPAVFRAMPYTGLAALLACLALAGLPPFLGYIAKEILYEALSENGWQAGLFLAAFILTNAMYFMLALKLSWGLFLGHSVLPNKIHDVGFVMWFPAMLLALIGIILGLGAAYFEPFFVSVVSALTKRSDRVEIDLSLWHGINISFILTVITWLAGFLLYVKRDRLVLAINKLKLLSFDRGYRSILAYIRSAALFLTRFLQSGFLTRYLKVIFGMLIVLLAWTYIEGGLFSEIRLDLEGDSFSNIYGFFPLLLIFIGTVFVLKSSSRLRILVCLSLVGYGIALLYAVYNAPDVSMTQFLVETITLVIFAIVLNRLPKSLRFPLEARKILIAGISATFGIIMALVLLSLLQYEPNPAMKDFYIQQSFPKGHGENVVNVMLVDFRAFDTFGEMAVLSMTALGVVALINLTSGEDRF
ncbi:hydrogen gas-evolving membrane-bound hydrogenase subunit E [Olivibacter sp. XZL3]|uniref:hydrogen gas-evolving membrane-bound hydrogenase subunit E n=1 Tax=Olivibacter sp. XZL3 TaxID=1735116 RepID=UPI001065E746|nr:hydrogen gas-evolving membrane-bound hydrogenase subunit E [Olivibacter sp. XZL3]